MSSKLFRIQSSYVMQTSSTHVERFFIQKRRFFFFWKKIHHNDYLRLEHAEEALARHLLSIKEENERKRTDKERKNKFKDRFYLMKNGKLLTGHSPQEVKRKKKLVAFL